MSIFYRGARLANPLGLARHPPKFVISPGTTHDGGVEGVIRVACLKLEFPPVGLNELLERITIRSMEGIRPAAEALRDSVMSLTGLRVAPCANIASKEPMVDDHGKILASAVLGWCDPA